MYNNNNKHIQNLNITHANDFERHKAFIMDESMHKNDEKA